MEADYNFTKEAGHLLRTLTDEGIEVVAANLEPTNNTIDWNEIRASLQQSTLNPQEILELTRSELRPVIIANSNPSPRKFLIVGDIVRGMRATAKKTHMIET